jgi:hypothetical protein
MISSERFLSLEEQLHYPGYIKGDAYIYLKSIIDYPEKEFAPKATSWAHFFIPFYSMI